MPRLSESRLCASKHPKAVLCPRYWRRSCGKPCCGYPATSRRKSWPSARSAGWPVSRALKAKYRDIEVGIDFEPEPGLADNGDLEHDLQALLEVVGGAAQKAGTALVLFIDELEYVEEEQLAALITALHRTAQRRVPVMLVGAGLPQLRGRMGRAKSYAERLFDFPEIGALSASAARLAIAKPARDQGVDVLEEALEKILRQTH